MRDLGNTIHEVLGNKLLAEGYDVVDLVPIPNHSDRMVRIRTLEEALEDFDNENSSNALSYLVQIRPRPSNRQNAAQSCENVYLPDGKLNISFLSRNAEILFSAGEYTLARNIFKAIHQSGERSAWALHWLGRCLESEGKPDEAEAHYEESLVYQPSLETYQYLGALLIRRKKDQNAAEILERALAMKDLPAKVRLELHKSCGNCWARAQMNDKAFVHFNKAIGIEPLADDIRVNLGDLTLQEQKTSEAKKHFQEALAANPKNDKALNGLGLCALADGDKRRAHDFFAKALDLRLDNSTALYHLVKCAYEIKSYATAARIVENYTEASPINANLLYSLAGLQFHLGRMEDARSTISKILMLQPEHAGAKELSGMIERYAGA